MEFKQYFNNDFTSIADEIYRIGNTEKSYIVSGPNDIACEVNRYSEHGLFSLGKTIGFPSNFIAELNKTNSELAEQVVRDRVNNYFKGDAQSFFMREFLGKISGCVSNKYAYFDDTQVADIISASPISKLSYAHSIVTPERLHLRAIDKENPFRVSNDKSDLFFCYFIDNSMVGLSSFKVQLGIYRLACSNGLIVPKKELVICKQIHRGNRDICAEFNETVAFLDEKRSEIIEMLEDLSNAEASILAMKDEHRNAFLARMLNCSKKETVIIIDLFNNVYGGKSKWAMVNAVTEFARSIENIERREYLESRALKVA